MTTSTVQAKPKALSLFVFDAVLVTDVFRGLRYGGVFSDVDIAELVEFGRVVRGIRARLITVGKLPDTTCNN